MLGVTVEASLSGLDVAADILDQTNPGLMICNTTFQEGNTELELSNPEYDIDSMELSVTYTDADANLPWFKSAQVCYPDGGNCFINATMIPDSHDYLNGVRFSASIADEEIEIGDYEAKFWFADSDDIGSYQTSINISIGSSCPLLGDSNADGTLNVLDVVLLANLALAGQMEVCADMNSDGVLNVLDIVLLVNIILAV